MSRLIDADALIKLLEKDAIDKMTFTEDVRYEGYLSAMIQVEDRIKSLPTISPKTGRWIERRSIAAPNRYECSVCKRMTRVDECMGKPLYAYCPWCGARNEEVTE